MLNTQKKLFLSLAIGLTGFVLFIGLIIFPLINKIKISSQECLNNQEVLIKLDQRISSLKELKRNYQENQDYLLLLENAFLDSKETVGFITTLETITRQTGNVFEIKSVRSDLLTEGQAPYLVLRVSLWGGFQELIDFLANLENIPYPPYRLMEIDNLTINRLSIDSLSRLDFDSRGNLETTLSIKVYLQ